MNLYKLSQLGFKHFQHVLVENVYLTTGFDMTRPVTFYAIINERCNVKCQHCGYWRLEHYNEELSTEQWQHTLLSLKSLVGSYSINFSGGEPFLRRDITDILSFCHQNGIYSGVTTNGAALTKSNVKKVVAAHPFNVNISCDGPNAEVHDEFRGMPGLFDKLVRGIELLHEEKEAQQVQFPIMIKSTISSFNLHLLEELVEWTQKMGADTISFQALERWTPETFDHLWINQDKWLQLEQVIEQLIKLKSQGAPILNDEKSLRLMLPYYREEPLVNSAQTTCLTGLRNYFIRPNGDVQLCYYFPVVGNVKQQEAHEIWWGEESKKVRKETIKCRKNCLTVCLYQRNLREKVKQAVKLFVKK